MTTWFLELGELKMNMKKIIAGHLLALVLFSTNVVSAADFNLNLKAGLSNLHPDVTNVKVKCSVSKPARAGRVLTIGEGSKTEKVPANGAIIKNILVQFNALPGKNPADASKFECRLIFLSRKRPDAEPLDANKKACGQAVNEFVCAKQGTAFNKVISGTIGNRKFKR